MSQSLSDYERAVLGLAKNALTDHRAGHPWAETCINWPREKRAAVKLAAKGLVKIRQTTETTGGMRDWWVGLTSEGEKIA